MTRIMQLMSDGAERTGIADGAERTGIADGIKRSGLQPNRSLHKTTLGQFSH
ncbi:hypothetical protein [Iningainema tapete]|uniref:Uncharacterized protein n=1 Tax=Iningainema tapete BLCC-T55 TaxID=2748662 RepID=A0A8J7BYP1_9CYAN|nr:hypothetical protein [Iningainema tapete]MBD2776102.1 hypothetical protein [Iningainema tapete BLCC-T55]